MCMSSLSNVPLLAGTKLISIIINRILFTPQPCRWIKRRINIHTYIKNISIICQCTTRKLHRPNQSLKALTGNFARHTPWVRKSRRSKMASRSVQMFLQGSRSWPADTSRPNISSRPFNPLSAFFLCLRFGFGWPFCAFTNYIYLLTYHTHTHTHATSKHL